MNRSSDNTRIAVAVISCIVFAATPLIVAITRVAPIPVMATITAALSAMLPLQIRQPARLGDGPHDVVVKRPKRHVVTARRRLPLEEFVHHDLIQPFDDVVRVGGAGVVGGARSHCRRCR